MNLYILRHGLAAERGGAGHGKDSDRPLTPKGERKLWKTAEAMEALKLSFDLILSSPYTRARQTAQIIAEAFNARGELEFSDALAPNGSAKKVIELIAALKPAPENVLLVGHEPYLSEFISLLATGETSSSVVLKKGGLCKVSAEALKPGRCAVIEWLLTPRQMLLMR
jgi:phosphohistidine phosphatase